MRRHYLDLLYFSALIFTVNCCARFGLAFEVPLNLLTGSSRLLRLFPDHNVGDGNLLLPLKNFAFAASHCAPPLSVSLPDEKCATILFFSQPPNNISTALPTASRPTVDAQQFFLDIPPNCSTENCVAHTLIADAFLNSGSKSEKTQSGLVFFDWLYIPNAQSGITTIDGILRSTRAYVTSLFTSLPSYLKAVPSHFQPFITISEEHKTLTIKDRNDTSHVLSLKLGAVQVFCAELVTLLHLSHNWPNLMDQNKGNLLVVFNPSDVLTLMEEDGWADDKLQAVHYTLERLMLAVLKDMNKQTRVNTLSTLISLPPNNKVYSAQTNDQEYEMAKFLELVVNDSGKSSRKRTLRSLQAQKAAPSPPPRPRHKVRPATMLWLCVSLCVVLLIAILPLYSLSSLNDPILATKLFTSSGR